VATVAARCRLPAREQGTPTGHKEVDEATSSPPSAPSVLLVPLAERQQSHHSRLCSLDAALPGHDAVAVLLAVLDILVSLGPATASCGFASRDVSKCMI
jgi:hypothetical protein